MGIKKDLDLQGDEYQWLGSLFYFGEFAFSVESCSRWLFSLIFGLSRISCLGVSNQSPAAAVATREVLGRLHSHLGIDFELLCGRQELWRRDCDSPISGSVRV